MRPAHADDHRRHPIEPADQPDHDHHADSAEPIDDFTFFHGHEYINEPADDERPPVTVADLLDLWDAVRTADATANWRHEYDDLNAARDRATADVNRSYFAVKRCVERHYAQRQWLARLSPDERAEFDRRTAEHGD